MLRSNMQSHKCNWMVQCDDFCHKSSHKCNWMVQCDEFCHKSSPKCNWMVQWDDFCNKSSPCEWRRCDPEKQLRNVKAVNRRMMNVAVISVCASTHCESMPISIHIKKQRLPFPPPHTHTRARAHTHTHTHTHIQQLLADLSIGF
jgi:hypothetical protein